MFMNYIREHLLLVPAAPARARVSRPRPMAAGAGGGVMSDSDAIDYSVHEAWNEATNVYLLVVLASLALLVYARRNKRKIMRIFTLPPTAEQGSMTSSHRNRLTVYSSQWNEVSNCGNESNFYSAENDKTVGMESFSKEL
ncbi:small integral membrane protein 19 isoform X2 [Emydura macquarii macquarii]|uniref:small integral membrane protein 19 isoform X2 n=1 Tax=Emydura macquarii macquarii TaxID=1129001 RepID=UPI00352A7329